MLELRRLLKSCTDDSRRESLNKSLKELDSKGNVGNDTILTSDFSNVNGMKVGPLIDACSALLSSVLFYSVLFCSICKA